MKSKSAAFGSLRTWVDAATLADELSGAAEHTLASVLHAFQMRRNSQVTRYQRAGAMMSFLLHADHPLPGL